MSGQPLPSEGPERRILLVGLSRLSRECSAPDLTPECPFYTRTAKGPVCAEQCIDLLAEHGAQGADESGQNLGGDWTAYRHPAPRPRRRHDANAKPFDATEILLHERDRTTGDKSTVGLMMTFRDLWSLPPGWFTDAAERKYSIEASWTELERRGLPVDDMVRYALSSAIAIGLSVSLLAEDLPAMVNEEPGNEVVEPPSAELVRMKPDPEWLALMEAAMEADGAAGRPRIAYVMGPAFSRRIESWVESAPRDDLVAFKAPTREAFLASPAPVSLEKRHRRAQWLVDRFTRTYFSDWRSSSLVIEWNYLHGSEPRGCSQQAMRERRPNGLEISSEMANRFADRLGDRTTQPPGAGMQTVDFVPVAVENLQAGRYAAAASLFAAVVAINPVDGEALNNLGFCLMPTEPAQALVHLDNARATLPETSKAVNALTRAQALHLLGRDDEAREAVRQGLAGAGTPPHRAWTWQHGGKALTLSPRVNPTEQLERFAEHLDEGRPWATCTADG